MSARTARGVLSLVCLAVYLGASTTAALFHHDDDFCGAPCAVLVPACASAHEQEHPQPAQHGGGHAADDCAACRYLANLPSTAVWDVELPLISRVEPLALPNLPDFRPPAVLLLHSRAPPAR